MIIQTPRVHRRFILELRFKQEIIYDIVEILNL